ncbi:cytochrome c family protein [Roseovarius sp. EL26]|uniref:c-type cytochrome n=1 Tax=Roseovarius sp. EL26 TaxID=2126672 RepID=UPI001C1FB87A|nr:cytochrome c family protein [Roseovarius sp. EL26]
MNRSLNMCLVALCTTLLPATTVKADLAEAIAAGDVKKGKKVFNKCKACHAASPDGKKKTGPNLYGIIGSDVAAVPEFKYSPALTEYGGSWSIDRLEAFLTRPKAEVKGTKMSFAGLKKEKDRVNLIAYLSTLSDAPAASETTETSTDESDENEFGILKMAPGAEETFYACSACHSEMIVAQQGLTRDGWEEMLEWMVDEQGMSEIEDPDLTIILDYLETHYNEDRPNFPTAQN